MNTLKQQLVMWEMLFPFHILMQGKKWQKKVLCAFLNFFFINLHRLISCNHKYMVQSNNSH